MKRVFLALIPVALLATASLAISGLTGEPFYLASAPSSEEAARPAQTTPPPATTGTVTTTQQVPQQESTVKQEDVAQAEPQEEPDEPLPVLVVDKTPLTQAMADLDKAIQQAKLAVTALDADTQQRYIQEHVNFLAGSGEPNFRLVAQSGAADSYKGVRPLLIQARVNREAGEVEWIAAVQRQLEARAKRLAELAQANGTGTGSAVTQPPTMDLSAVVGPTGVLGTRGVRPEEQANDLVTRAIKQAVDALRLASNRPQPSIQDGEVATNHASDDATQMIESILRTLETAKKIIQIAIDR